MVAENEKAFDRLRPNTFSLDYIYFNFIRET